MAENTESFQNVTLQFYSDNPQVAFPLFLSSAGSLVSVVANYGYILKVSASASANQEIMKYAGMVNNYTGSFSYLPFAQNNASSPCSLFSPLSASSGYYTPTDIYNAYSFNSANAANLTGTGMKIAIVDAFGDPLLAYDLASFDNASGLPPVNLKVIYMNNTPNLYNQSWAIETALDVEWAHAAAPGAQIILVITPDASSSLTDAISYIVSNRIANIVTLSWGQPESQISSNTMSAENQLFRQAAAENITVLAASGDKGAYDGTGTLSVNYPASDPYVLAVGGTSLDYSSGSYVQTAWGGTVAGTSFGSGGGFSTYFNRPYWQSGLTNSSFRGLPDVSADADKNTGVFIVADGHSYIAGGTSLSSPIWSGITARIDQKIGSSIGLISPVLYQLYRSPYYADTFTQITSGGNGYYSSTAGWDPVTGLGAPIVSGLLKYVPLIRNDYGSIVEYNNSYGFSSLSATLTLSACNGKMLYNGSAFYYLASYYSNTSYVKFGIEENSTGVYTRLSEACGSNTYVNATRLGTIKSAASYGLKMTFNGTSLLLYLNNSLVDEFPVMLRYFGSSLAAVGAEIIDPVDNLTNIPQANFTSISLLNATGSAVPVNTWQTHYSGLSGIKTYSTINAKSIAGNITFSSGASTGDGRLEGSSTTQPYIIFQAAFTSIVTYTFSLSQPESSVIWYVNGSKQTSGVISFSEPGSYIVSAQFAGGNASRIILVPKVVSTTARILNPTPFYTPAYSYLLDGSIQGNATLSTGNLTFSTVSGLNFIEISAPNFSPAKASFTAGSNFTVPLEPVNATVCVFAYPGNANVTINGTHVKGSSGRYEKNIYPGNIQINVTAPGYTNYSSTARVIPGSTYTQQVILQPAAGMLELSGNVSNAIFSFPLSGANVSIAGGAYSYTNLSGYYVLFASAGTYNVTYSANGYNASTISVTLSTNRTENIGLYPVTLNASQTFLTNVSFFFPIGYLALYISWGLPQTPGAVSFIVDYSSYSNMSGYNQIIVSGTSTYTVIFPIIPQSTYYVQILVELASGQVVPGAITPLHLFNLFDVLINLAIYAGIISYLVIAVGVLRRAFRRKRA